MNNIIIVVIVVVLITVVLAYVTAIRRRATRAGQVEIHGTLIVPKAVRKVQSIRVALIKRIEVCETERSIRSEKTWSPERRQVKELLLSVRWKNYYENFFRFSLNF